MSHPHFAFDLETNHPTTKSDKLKREWRENAQHKIAGISFAWRNQSVEGMWKPGDSAYIPLSRADDSDYWGTRQDKVWGMIEELLTNDARKNAFNSKFDVGTSFEIMGIKVKNMKFDPMLAKSLIDEEGLDSSFALKSKFNANGDLAKLGCSDFYLDTEGSLFKKDLDDALLYYDPKFKRYPKVPLNILYPYGCADADLSLSLEFAMIPLLEAEGLLWVFDNLIMPLSHTLMRGELHGVPLDMHRAVEVRDCQAAVMEDSEWWFEQLSGRDDVNISSNKQLGDVLFNQMGFPGEKSEKGNWKTDADTLKKINHPVIEPLVVYSRAQQIHNNYAVSALDRIREITHEGKIGWVHHDQQIWSKTGRVRCFNPNLATLPRPENGGHIVKSMWAGDPNYRFVLKDFSQIEMRVAAHLSQEPIWIQAFLNGEDMHSKTAKSVFGLECEVSEVKSLYPEKRSDAKTVNFGIIYGETVYGLARNLDRSVPECQQILDDYFRGADTLQRWILSQHDKAAIEGFVLNLFGRRRHLPDAGLEVPDGLKWPEDPKNCYRKGPSIKDLGISLDDMYDVTPEQMKEQIRSTPGKRFNWCLSCPFIRSCVINRERKYYNSKKERAKRQAVNASVQSSAVDMCSFCIVWCAEEFMRQNLDAIILLHLHDEIMVYCRNDHVEQVGKIMDYYMTDYLPKFINFSIPVTVDTEVIYRWSEKGQH